MKHIPIKSAEILLPNKNINMNLWAVVACDQFTSQPEYWEKLGKTVKEHPSTLKLIFPEIYLVGQNSNRTNHINMAMKEYLTNGTLQSIGNGYVLTERTLNNGSKRLGIVASIDLEDYSFNHHDKTLIRSTEETLLERIPPRIKIRTNAQIELPHIMLLVDDSDFKVIEPIYEDRAAYPLVYNFKLNMDGGSLKGWFINDTSKIDEAFASLLEEETLIEKYGTADSPLLFAVGDGNHSLATAKQCWNNIKPTLTDEMKLVHPSRFALVEIVNVYDEALNFEPIHRVVFDVEPKEFLKEIKKNISGTSISYTYYSKGKKEKLTMPASAPDAVKSVQNFIDNYLRNHTQSSVDYVHGDESLKEVIDFESGRVGVALTALRKEELFRYVIKNGNLTRKSFSMGNAIDKRYYCEARKITL